MKQKFTATGSSWTLTDDAIKYGFIFKNTIRLDEIREMDEFLSPDEGRKDSEGRFRIFRWSLKDRMNQKDGTRIYDPGIMLWYRSEQYQDAVKAIHYIIEHSGMNEEERAAALRDMEYGHSGAARRDLDRAWARLASSEPSKTNKKDASVVGRAVVGGVVAGPAGAVVGALSAVDKNNRNKD